MNYLLKQILVLFISCLSLNAIDLYGNKDTCCGTPLHCGNLNLEGHLGIAPFLWENRECFLLGNCLTGTTDINVIQLSALGKLPSVHTLYKPAWDIGFRIGFALTHHIEVTLEFDAVAAKARQGGSRGSVGSCCSQFTLCYTTSVADAGTTNLVFTGLSTYKSYLGHVGVRLYSDRFWCDRISVFGGIKAGFARHRTIFITIHQAQILPDDTALIDVPPFPFFRIPLFFRNTAVSAGVCFGIDYCFAQNFSLVIQGNALWQGPLRSSTNLGSGHLVTCGELESCGQTLCIHPFQTNNPTADIVGARFNSELIFPVTFGLKYYY